MLYLTHDRFSIILLNADLGIFNILEHYSGKSKMPVGHGMVEDGKFLMRSHFVHHMRQECFVNVVIQISNGNFQLWWYANIIFIYFKSTKKESSIIKKS